MKKTLIFIPTYNERDNVGRMCAEISALGLDADLVFMDDASPDGTGALLDELASKTPRVSVIHRAGKAGIGSAHLDGDRVRVRPRVRSGWSRSTATIALSAPCSFR